MSDDDKTLYFSVKYCEKHTRRIMRWIDREDVIVVMTKRGRPHVVMVSAARYDRMRAAAGQTP